MESKLINLEADKLAEKIIDFGLENGSDEFQVKIRDTTARYIRYANSEIHQFSEETIREIKMVSLIGQKKGLSSVTLTSDEKLLEAIKKVVALTKVNAADPDQLSLFEGSENYQSVKRVDSSFEEWDAEKMAHQVIQVISTAHDIDPRVTNVSGMLQCLKHSHLLANSQGLSLSTDQTEYWFGIDVLVKDGSTTGRNSLGEVNSFAKNIPFDHLTKEATNYALLGLNPVKLPPGEYPAVLDYYGVLEPMVFLNLGLSALFVIQHRSFLARKMGQQIFSPEFNWKHTPHNPNIITSKPYDDEGIATKELYFIKDGQLIELAHNRGSAKKMGIEPNGCGYESERTTFGIPIATQLETTNTTKQELIESIDDGIFISRLFYTNWANPMAGILTGVTRNGFYKIENGEIISSLYPMRHSTSIFDMFGEGFIASKELHQPPMQMMPGVQSILIPAVKVPKMRMTTYSN